MSRYFVPIANAFCIGLYVVLKKGIKGTSFYLMNSFCLLILKKFLKIFLNYHNCDSVTFSERTNFKKS